MKIRLIIFGILLGLAIASEQTSAVIQLDSIKPQPLLSIPIYTLPLHYTISLMKHIYKIYIFIRTTSPLNLIAIIYLTFVAIRIFYRVLAEILTDVSGMKRTWSVDITLNSQVKDLQQQIKMVQKEIRDVEKYLRAEKIKGDKQKKNPNENSNEMVGEEVNVPQLDRVDSKATYRAMQLEIDKKCLLYRQIEQEIKESCNEVLNILKKCNKKEG